MRWLVCEWLSWEVFGLLDVLGGWTGRVYMTSHRIA